MALGRRSDENNLRMLKVIYVPAGYIMKNDDGITVLGQFLNKPQIQIFRVAIFMKIGHIFYLMGTLIKKVTSDLSILR